MILKNTNAPIRKSASYFSLALALLLSVLGGAPAQALDTRVIDIVSVSWNRSGPLAGTVVDAQKEIETKVGPLWRDLTTIYGDPEDKRIQFVFGKA